MSHETYYTLLVFPGTLRPAEGTGGRTFKDACETHYLRCPFTRNLK